MPQGRGFDHEAVPSKADRAQFELLPAQGFPGDGQEASQRRYGAGSPQREAIELRQENGHLERLVAHLVNGHRVEPSLTFDSRSLTMISAGIAA